MSGGGVRGPGGPRLTIAMIFFHCHALDSATLKEDGRHLSQRGAGASLHQWRIKVLF